jgi:tRNA-intron endonuclease
MALEGLTTIKGTLNDEDLTVVVDEPKEAISLLKERGYGRELEGGGLALYYYEALYLLYAGRLVVEDAGKQLKFEELAERAIRRFPGAWVAFMVYRDLRSRGYVVREGFGFGLDFRVYEAGTYGNKPAKYVVFCLNEGFAMKLLELDKLVRGIMRIGKQPIIAVLERRGEVIYYEVAKLELVKS